MKKKVTLLHPHSRICIFLLFLFIAHSTFAQLNPALDVQHYSFSINLNDSNNIIEGDAVITIKFKQTVKEVTLDLLKQTVNKVSLDLLEKTVTGKGMIVTQVTKNGSALHFSQDSNQLIIGDTVIKGAENTYEIKYNGEPADGLYISKNKFGERTFFGDNWPERAHNWLPCNDHVADKASVEFIVTAPDHYQVVANGLKIEETNLPDHLKRTHWKEDVPLPTKIMAIGVADFAVNYIGDVNTIPVYSWVFPQDRDSGFMQYAIAKNILQWYMKHVGPYAYKKLANVESKTMFGGMENANTIFYYEGSVHSEGLEALMAHEIAHQWFGNAVSEKDWPHIWLSEGFATYMTHLYIESTYGTDSFNNRLHTDRDSVIAFSKRTNTAVVDTTASNDLFHLLNINSYEKGGWVLHMLRRKIGDVLFWKGIQNYYKTYAGSNANTENFEKIIEKTSHQNLQAFFKQWCYIAGQPDLNITWSYNTSKRSIKIKVEQLQNNLFMFPLQVGLPDKKRSSVKTINIKNKITVIEFPFSNKPDKIDIDPNVNLLFEGDVQEVER